MKTATPSRTRPAGVVVICGLLVFFVGYSIVSIIAPIFGWPIDRIYVPMFDRIDSIFGVPIQNLGLFRLAAAISMSVVYLIVAVGFWRMYLWAWIGAMLLAGLGLLLTIWGYVNGYFNPIAMSVEVVIVLYLNQRDTQEAFTERMPKAAKS